jgi:hypothetical protein
MDDEEEYNLWRREYANLLLRACVAVQQMQLFAPEDANPGWYASRMVWCEQEANEVWPPEHSWPRHEAEIFDFHTKERVNQ